jgi:lipid A 3-O-deacylase
MNITNVGCRLLIAVFVFAAICTAAAQQLPMAQSGATELTAWGGGGSGLGHADTTQMAAAGFRFGLILTDQHGSGWRRGNLEYAFDVVPLYLFFQNQTVLTPAPVRGREAVYGGSITPLVFKWNFTSGKRIVPFAGIEGSAIFTTKNVPAGDTSVVNFGSGIASGVQFMRGQRHSFFISGHLLHISNASLGNKNPGLNSNLQLRLGYQWWR